MDDVKVTVGERTRLRRNALGLTRERLAELIGVSPRFLADVESGKVGVSLATLKRMCTALECTADFLIGNDQIGHPDYSRMLLNSELDRLDVRFYPALRACGRTWKNPALTGRNFETRLPQQATIGRKVRKKDNKNETEPRLLPGDN